VIQSHGLPVGQGVQVENGREGLFPNCRFAHAVKLWRQPTAHPPQISARTVPWYLFMSNTCVRVYKTDSRSVPRRYSVPQHDSFQYPDPPNARSDGGRTSKVKNVVPLQPALEGILTATSLCDAPDGKDRLRPQSANWGRDLGVWALDLLLLVVHT